MSKNLLKPEPWLERFEKQFFMRPMCDSEHRNNLKTAGSLCMGPKIQAKIIYIPTISKYHTTRRHVCEEQSPQYKSTKEYH